MNTPCRKNKDCPSNVCEMIYENNKPKGRFCIGSDNRYTIKCNVNKDCKSNICEKIYDEKGNFLVKKCVKAPKIDDDSAYNTLFGKERSNKYGNINGNALKLISDDGGPITEIIIKVIDLIFNIFNIIVFNFNACSDAKADARKECQDFYLNYTYVDEYGVKKKVVGDSIENYRYRGYFNNAIKSKKCERRCKSETHCSCNPMTEKYNQAIIYGIWRAVFDGVFKAFGGKAGGWIFAPSSAFYHMTTKKDQESNTAPQCSRHSYGVDLWYFRTLITILFPPFGVLLAKGLNGLLQIFISCILTCLFYFPGLIYSFAVINSSPLDLREIKGFEKINAKNTNRQDYLDELEKSNNIVNYNRK